MAEKGYQLGEFYQYPLIIKKLLNTPLIYSPDQEIVYSDRHRYTYTDLNKRIARLANGLAGLGIGRGDTVAVFDYDSHRFLECFFAIPMMGAVLQTVNWRLSAEQVLYTINHTETKLIIIHSDFLPILESIQDKLDTVKTIVTIAEGDTPPITEFKADAEYETLLKSSASSFPFEDLDENTKATTFYTTGTTGNPKGVYFTHRQLVLHTLSVAISHGSYHTIARFRSNDVYMPMMPMFHVHAWGFPYVATLLGAKQVYAGQYEPEKMLKLIQKEKVTFSHCVPTILQMLFSSPAIISLFCHSSPMDILK
jgi:fatty-acyl-CoA synthase